MTGASFVVTIQWIDGNDDQDRMRSPMRQPPRRGADLGCRGRASLLGRRHRPARRQPVDLADESADRQGRELALDDGFYFFDFNKGALDLITRVDEDQPRSRLNDGKCDRRGRFFAGGMDDKEELKICSLWRLDPDLKVTKVEEGIICTNGPCWSPDDKTFYLTDTFQGDYWAYDYDIEKGSLSNRRVFASYRDDEGVADGSTVDAEGFLWNAQLISGELVRYAPDGTVERRIGMPVRNITSVNFGGDKLDEIYVTSMARVKHPAVHDLFAKEAKPQFLAGSLFRITGLGIQGVEEPRFAG
jgi:sugar lactone lactonase YvrE